jgi:hypothetical protein
MPSYSTVCPCGFGLGRIVQLVPSHCSTTPPDCPPIPTAKQLVVLEHETASRPVNVKVDTALVTFTLEKNEPGSGLATTVQFAPSQRSMIPLMPVRDAKSPTAKQLVVLAHETPLRLDSMLPARFGVAMTFQLVPFHRSTNVRDDESGPDVEVSPTAKQLVAPGHEIPDRLVAVAPFGAGLGTMFQLVPFHRSISGASLSDTPAKVDSSPTAKQFVALEQATPFRSTSPSTPLGTGLGLGTIDQTDPSHRSINVPWSPPPTAKQLVGVVHATAERPPSGGPAGLGLGETDQRNAAPDGDALNATTPVINARTVASRSARETRNFRDRLIGRIKPHSPANDPRQFGTP